MASPTAGDEGAQVRHWAEWRGGLVAGSKVVLAGGSAVAVEYLLRNHFVQRPDGSVTRIVSVQAVRVEQRVCFVSTAAGVSLGAMPAQPIVCRCGIKPAAELRAGEELLLGWNEYAPVTQVRSEQYEGHVYFLEIEGDAAPGRHYMIANGIVVGDITIVRRLQVPPVKSRSARSGRIIRI